MKRKILLALIIALWCAQIHSQDDSKLFYFGVGIGFGIFSPADVNDELNRYYSSYLSLAGTWNMYVYYALSVKGSFFFSRYTELQCETEWGVAPKLILEGSDLDMYYFNRITPEVKFNLHIPASDRFSVYFGPGVNWNWLRFTTANKTKYTGNSIGYSAQAGVMMRFGKWSIEPFLSFKFAKTDDIERSSGGSVNLDDLFLSELSFTGVQVGNTFFF
jgi:outer membrane protein W